MNHCQTSMEALTPHPRHHHKKPPKSYSTQLTLLNIAESPSYSKSSFSNISYTFDHSLKLDSLASIKLMHALLIKKHDPDKKLSSLITPYMKCADFHSALVLFLVGFPENYLYWKDFFEEFKGIGGNLCEIFRVLVDLNRKGVSFDCINLTIVLKMCGHVMEKWLGLEIHGYAIKMGFDFDVYLRCALMNFYEKCWGVDSAENVFVEVPDRDVILWNEAVLMNVRTERWWKALTLFRDMQFSLVKASIFTLARALQACAKFKGLDEGRQIHGYVIRSSLDSDLLICNSLISMYCKNEKLQLARSVFDSMENINLSSWNSIISGYTALGNLNEAHKLFQEMDNLNIEQDIVTWNALLSGHLACGSYEEALALLQRMKGLGFKFDSISITSILQVISELGLLKLGKETHGYVIRNGHDHDVYVGTSLIDMYVKNDDIAHAQAIFSSMKGRNVFAWNSLMSGYSYKGCFEDAIKLWKSMRKEGIKPDIVTYNTMISGYSQWGQVKEALSIIREIKSLGLTPNVVSWTALISGCWQNGNYRDAVDFFIEMQRDGVSPNSTTITIVLQACAGLSLLQKGKEIHCSSIRNGYIDDVFVSTALIDLYSKSGSFKNAYRVFRNIHNKTIASWNSMMMGFSLYSLGQQAISLFNEMQEEGIKPDAITFTALLSCCKQSGLIKEGWKYFDSMSTDFDIIPTIEHYSCMVDLLGRAGYIDEAWEFMKTMPLVPDAAVWGALLGSCKTRDHLKIAEIAAKKLFKLEPHNPANYVCLMSLYSISDRSEHVDQVKDMMGDMGIKNGHVWSWIQIDQEIHHFSALGEPHPDEGRIYFELYHLIPEMRKLGYVPDISCVYSRMEEAEKEKVLLMHTEKLAMTYGLMKMRRGEVIRVIKNTRVCMDCHEMGKYLSLLSKRKIVLKDGARFHVFSKGKCSCNDCW